MSECLGCHTESDDVRTVIFTGRRYGGTKNADDHFTVETRLCPACWLRHVERGRGMEVPPAEVWQDMVGEAPGG